MASILDAGNIIPPMTNMASPRVPLIMGTSLVAGSIGNATLRNVEYDSALKMMEFESEYPELKGMSRDERIKFLKAKSAELKIDWEAKRHERIQAEEKLEILNKKRKVIDFVTKWGRSLKIEKPDGTSFRALRKAVAEGNTVCFGARDVYAEIPSHDYEKEVFRFAEVFMIEHDWETAFGNANIDDATVKLPYDVCAFEFKFSGHPVIALATQFCSEIVVTPAIYHEGVWMMMDFVGNLHDTKIDTGNEGALILMQSISKQIKAACIALDADVATAEVVREPFTSAHGKNNYQPLKGYHVVRLANRGARALPRSDQRETGRHVRLHFRRGHWRHFEAHKTWIKWMLVGDPDLGFVDKHYRL